MLRFCYWKAQEQAQALKLLSIDLLSCIKAVSNLDYGYYLKGLISF